MSFLSRMPMSKVRPVTILIMPCFYSQSICIKGVCNDVDESSKKVSILYGVYKQSVKQSLRYLSKYCHSTMPSGNNSLRDVKPDWI